MACALYRLPKPENLRPTHPVPGVTLDQDNPDVTPESVRKLRFAMLSYGNAADYSNSAIVKIDLFGIS
jgi:hypothetical protein